MPISFDLTSNGFSRLTSNTSDTNSFIHIDVPTGVSNNDLLLAIIHQNSIANPGTLIPPAGWTNIANNYSTDGTSNLHTWIGYRIARSEPEWYTWEVSPDNRDDHGWILRATGHSLSNTVDVIGSFSTSGSLLNPTVSSITTTINNALAFWVVGARNGSNLAADDTNVAPTGTTQLLFKKSRTSSVGVGSGFATEVIPTAGATGTRTFNGVFPTTGARSSTIGFALTDPTWPIIRKIGSNETIRANDSGVIATGNNLSGQTTIAIVSGSRTLNVNTLTSNSTAVTFNTPNVSSLITANVKFGDIGIKIDRETSIAVLQPSTDFKVHNVIDISQASNANCIYNGLSPAIVIGDQILYSNTSSLGYEVLIDSQGFPILLNSSSEISDNFTYRIFDVTDETWGLQGTFTASGSGEFVFQAERFVETGQKSGANITMKICANGTIEVGELREVALTPSLKLFANASVQAAQFIEVP